MSDFSNWDLLLCFEWIFLDFMVYYSCKGRETTMNIKKTKALYYLAAASFYIVAIIKFVADGSAFLCFGSSRS